MTPARRRELECTDAKLTKEELAAGYHFCPDWDFMLLGPDAPEMECCLCGVEIAEERT